MDEEEFPSLCEEIDPDVLKKVAHGQPMNGLVHRGQASNLEKIKDQESRQSGTHWMIFAEVYLLHAYRWQFRIS